MTSTSSLLDHLGGPRIAGFVAGVVLAVLVRAWPTPTDLGTEAHTVAAVAVLMAVWWVFRVLPMAVTALVPMVAFPPLGVATLTDVSKSYAHPLLYLMLGGFVIGHAMERVGLHRRLTAWLLTPSAVRASPRAVLAALMVVAACLSGMVSNTATTLMMLPLAASLGRRCGGDRMVACFVLGLAYAASIGGMSTLVGTPPNAVLAGFAPDLAGVELGFGQWMRVGIPAVVVLLPVAWWALSGWTFSLPRRFEVPLDRPVPPPIAPGERAVWVVTGLALVAWLTRAPKDLGVVQIPGWAERVSGQGSALDAGVALTAAFVLFLVPARDGERRYLLQWQEVERAVPWSVLILLGGGFALAGAIGGSGLTAWLAQGADAVRGLPAPLVVLTLCLGMTFLTELTSNTATATIALPLLAEAAGRAGVEPMMWMVPATLSASCAFMMPVATAPNAIASEAGGVDPADMARAGLLLNLLGAVCITALSLVLVPAL